MTTKTTIKGRTEKRGKGFIKPTYFEVPVINFGGKYLQTAGFEIGEKLCVEVNEGEIIIKRTTPELLRMIGKNPDLKTLIDTFNFKQVA